MTSVDMSLVVTLVDSLMRDLLHQQALGTRVGAEGLDIVRVVARQVDTCVQSVVLVCA